MKKCFSTLGLLTVSGVAIAHNSTAAAGVHTVEHLMAPAIWVLAVVALIAIIKNKRFK